MDTKLEEMKPSCEWKLYTDGASRSDGSGAGLMLIDPKDSQLLVKIKGIYAAKQPAIKEYLQRTKETLRRDIARIIQEYEKCKEQYAMRKRAEIRAITAGNAWPFSRWRVSILGPLPTALGGLKFLAIATEHSTK
ncbi:hypothetical protein Tco_1562535 [Tanacetum coccineum]